MEYNGSNTGTNTHTEWRINLYPILQGQRRTQESTKKKPPNKKTLPLLILSSLFKKEGTLSMFSNPANELFVRIITSLEGILQV